MRIFITGSAGFIGYHLAERLLAEGHEVTGFDAMTPYYDVALKQARHARLARHGGFSAVTGSLEDAEALANAAGHPEIIVHLAAQAGVRYSLENPRAYIDANLAGSWNVLDLATRLRPAHLLLASSSSVYGANSKIPFAETDDTAAPMSLYAATKVGMEAMAHALAHLHGMPVTALRFFTVYGAWGRPDMALFKFTDAILDGRPIDVYGEGRQQRDYTYVADAVEAVHRLLPLAPAPYRVVNIGGGRPVGLLDFIATLENVLGREAIPRMLPMQAGDVPRTFASTKLLEELTGYRPATTLADGVAAFVAWYREYYRR